MRFMRSGRFLLAVCASAVCLSVAPTAPAQVTPGQARAALEAQYPTVHFYEKGERVRTVYGAKMTRGMTPEEAGEAWLAAHGAVFGTDQPDVHRFRSIPLPDGVRTVLMYKQRMDGLPVVGSSLRILVRGQNPAQVVYAAGRIAIRPQGGLPEPILTAAQAVAAAQQDPLGRDLGPWSEPELVAIYDDAPLGSAVAYPAWRFSGAGELDSRRFYVHAVTGEVVRHHSGIMRLSDITGNVEGKATTGLKPDTWGEPPSGGTLDCPNPAAEINLSDVLIEARDPSTLELIDSAYTNSDGDYVLDVPDTVTVKVQAHLTGPGWTVRQDIFDPPSNSQCYGEPLDPQEITVTAPASGKNFLFNASPTEDTTAQVNVQAQMPKTWNYVEPVVDFVPVIPVVTNSTVTPVSGYVPEGEFLHLSCQSPQLAPYPGVLVMAKSTPQGSPPLANGAYSTVISHEYGHFVLFESLGIDYNDPAFHEGFSDVLAHLVYDTTLIAEDILDCGKPIRAPLSDDNEDVKYPECGSTQHTRGMVLSKAWLFSLINFRDTHGTTAGLAEIQSLHKAWMVIAQPPGSHPSCSLADQAADTGTLLELLVLDSPDEDPTNAPHLEELCDAFALVDIDGDGVCEEALGAVRRPDCDGDRVVTMLDFLCFQNAFVSGERYADCDRDGRLTVFDFLCFQDAFVLSCKRADR